MKQRMLTAIIGIIIIVPIILYGGWPFLLTAYLLATVALFELVRTYKLEKLMNYLFIATIFLWVLLYPQSDISFEDFTVTKFDILIIFASILLIAIVISKNKFTFDQASFFLLATLYIGASFYYLIIVRFEGLNYFLFILFIIWATDSGAYFVGKYLGKRKLWPEISPNKTIGGAVGGILAAVFVAILFQWIYPFDKSYLSIFFIAIFISVVGQFGDLVASAIKRHYDIKDFGKIFPGHGGILDRLDSLIFVMLALSIIQFI